jgi:hypothetical protein
MITEAQPVVNYYTSNVGTFDYSESAAWNGNSPSSDGVLDKMILLSSGSVITRTNTGSGNSIYAQGSSAYGSGPGAENYSLYVVGSLTIEGDLEISGDKFYIANGGVVIVYGNVTITDEIYVADGGTLIIYGSLTTTQLLGGKVNGFGGDVIVAGDVNLRSFYINTSGNLVVGGELIYDADFSYLNGDIYALNDDTPVASGTYSSSNDVGDLSDFENDPDYVDLIDIVEQLGMIAEASVSQTTASTYTFTVPEGVISITVECWGAGGAGGGSTINDKGGSGGGGGAYVSAKLSVQPGDVIEYIVGAGGIGSTSNGTDGGDTEFLTLIAEGGSGGGANNGTVGIGGSASGGTTNTSGENGLQGLLKGRAGGAGANGGDGGSGNVSDSNGNDGSGPGGGGSGGEYNDRVPPEQRSKNGGAGADGKVIISYRLPVTFYSINSGDALNVNNWNTQKNGSGDAPLNFSTDNQTFEIQGGHQMTTSGDWDLNSLLVELNAGTQLTVNGNLITGNHLTINNTPDSPTSIIVNGVVTGEATINWHNITASEYQLMGHSISDITLADYDSSFPGGYNLYYYDNGWAAVVDDSDIDNNPMRGYDYKIYSEGESLSYSGILNNGSSYTYTADARSWHLVANPYHSYIDVQSEGFDFGGFENTIYIRQGNNEVMTYDISDPANPVAVNGASNILAPNQGVWVWTSTAGSEISISSSARKAESSSVSLKSSAEKYGNIFRLLLESEYSNDEMVLVFNENGSESNSVYDAEKMLAYGSIANLYSIKEDEDLVINALPEILSETVVPFGYKVASSGLGDFTFKASNLDGFNDHVSVHLKDMDTDVIVDLRENDYTFTATEAEDNDRFEIIFDYSESVTTAIDEEKNTLSDESVMVYIVKQMVTVQVAQDLLTGSDKQIEVYNLAGHLVDQYELNTTETIVYLPKAYTVYIIRVKIDDAYYQEKVVGMR